MSAAKPCGRASNTSGSAQITESIAEKEGFNAIIGNPPYIRVQNMVRYSPMMRSR